MKLLSSTKKNHEQKKASVALLIGTQGENKKQKKCVNWAPIIVACLQLLWLNLTRSAKHASNAGAGSNQPAFCIFGPMGHPPWPGSLWKFTLFLLAGQSGGQVSGDDSVVWRHFVLWYWHWFRSFVTRRTVHTPPLSVLAIYWYNGGQREAQLGGNALCREMLAKSKPASECIRKGGNAMNSN